MTLGTPAASAMWLRRTEWRGHDGFGIPTRRYAVVKQGLHVGERHVRERAARAQRASSRLQPGQPGVGLHDRPGVRLDPTVAEACRLHVGLELLVGCHRDVVTRAAKPHSQREIWHDVSARPDGENRDAHKTSPPRLLARETVRAAVRPNLLHEALVAVEGCERSRRGVGQRANACVGCSQGHRQRAGECLVSGHS